MAVDANALDRDGSPRDALVEGFLAAAAAGRLRLVVPPGVRDEMGRAGAPAAVRAFAAALAPPPPPRPLSAAEHIARIRLRAMLRGDGRPGKHDADAAHLSDAAEAGCAAFVTRDGKVLRRRDVLAGALPPGFRIVSLEEFMAGGGP